MLLRCLNLQSFTRDDRKCKDVVAILWHDLILWFNESNSFVGYFYLLYLIISNRSMSAIT